MITRGLTYVHNTYHNIEESQYWQYQYHNVEKSLKERIDVRVILLLLRPAAQLWCCLLKHERCLQLWIKCEFGKFKIADQYLATAPQLVHAGLGRGGRLEGVGLLREGVLGSRLCSGRCGLLGTSNMWSWVTSQVCSLLLQMLQKTCKRCLTMSEDVVARLNTCLLIQTLSNMAWMCAGVLPPAGPAWAAPGCPGWLGRSAPPAASPPRSASPWRRPPPRPGPEHRTHVTTNTLLWWSGPSAASPATWGAWGRVPPGPRGWRPPPPDWPRPRIRRLPLDHWDHRPRLRWCWRWGRMGPLQRGDVKIIVRNMAA